MSARPTSASRRVLAWRYPLLAALVATLPAVVPNAFFLNLGSEIALAAIAGIGLNLLLGLSGQMSLGQAGFFAVGAYASALLTQHWGWPLAVTIPAAALVAGIAGAPLGLVALRARSHYLAMVTLAFGFIVGVVAQRWVEVTGGSQGLVGLPQLSWGDLRNAPRNYFWTVGAAWLMVQLGSDYVMASRPGRVLRAIAESESFAATVGIRAWAWRTGIFVVAAALAGLAGALFTHQVGYISSDSINIDRSLSILIVAVVGGLGRSFGPMLGALFLVGLSQATAELYAQSGYILGGLLLAVMLLLPDGLSDLLPRRRRVAAGTIGGAAARPTLDVEARACRSNGPVLELEDVTKSYAGVAALQGVSLRVERGTVHALIGPNGAGKSTLINVVSGLYAPSSGRVLLDGEDVTRWPAHRRARHGLARTFQNLQLIAGLSVIQNVMLGHAPGHDGWRSFGRWLTGAAHEERDREAARALLDTFGIGAHAESFPSELSYGHRKLAELARALAQHPALLLLDEPVAGLNEEESRQIAEGIARLRAGGVAVLLVEHDMPFVMGLADEVTVLDYGRKIAAGRPEQVRADPAVVEAYLGAEAAA